MDIPTDQTEQQELLTELAYRGILTPTTYQRAAIEAFKRVLAEWPIAGLKDMELHVIGRHAIEERGLGYDHP